MTSDAHDAKAAIKVAVVQFAPGTELSKNLRRADLLITKAAQAGADLIGLPEVFTVEYRKDLFHSVGEDIAPDAGIITVPTTGTALLAARAREHKVTIFGGIVERADGLFYNSVAAYGPTGGLLTVYRKIHLSCVRVGADRTSEADLFTPGSAGASFVVGGWRVGLGVCFDLRFDLHRTYTRSEAPCDILAYPSAFLESTGQHHWELLLRARGLDEQVYVLAPNHAKDGGQVTKMFGHAMVCGPWGQVLCSTGAREADGVAVADVTRAELLDVRARIPLRTVRRELEAESPDAKRRRQ